VTDTQADYIRTDELDDALVPLDVLRDKLGVSERTLRRRLEGIPHHAYPGGKAVRWGDVKNIEGLKR